MVCWSISPNNLKKEVLVATNIILSGMKYWETARDALSDQPNKLIWLWTQEGIYSAQLAYKLQHASQCNYGIPRTPGSIRLVLKPADKPAEADLL